MTAVEREILHALNKAALIAAHRAGDWEAAKILSQKRQRLKKGRRNYCETCGVVLSYGGKRFCSMHHSVSRRNKKVLLERTEIAV